MGVNGVYEATGLALWLRTGAVGAADLFQDDINWQTLQTFEESFFSRSVCFKANVTRGSKKQKSRERLLWPCTMICGVVSMKTLEEEHFDSSLPLAGGWFVLWSWYLAMFKALSKQDCLTGRVFKQSASTSCLL